MDQFIAEGEQIADEEYQAAMAEAEQKAIELAQAAELKMPEVVNLIVERVKSSVNM